MKRRRLLISSIVLPLAAWLPALRASVRGELVGDRDVYADGISIDIPRIAETGNSVPLTVSVESPMTEADHVNRLHILVPGNPEEKAATYKLTPMTGKAEISTRIRLARTQTVRAIAEMSDGSLLGTGVNVVVTVGACVEEIWTD